jgi:hypothetical protein
LNRPLITIAKFAVSFGILAYLFANAWHQNQFQQLAAATQRWEWWLVGLAACLVATLVSFYRWWALARAIDLPLALSDAIRLGFISQLFNLLSIGVFGGDAMRAIAAARQLPQRMPEAVASVVIDRAIGLLAMFVFGAVAYWLSDLSAEQAVHPQTLEAVRVVCVFATVVSVFGMAVLTILLFMPSVDRWPLLGWFQSLPRVGPLIERLWQVVVVYRRNKPQVFAAFLNSMSVNGLLALSMYAIARGISDVHPDLVQHMVISPVVMVANAAPLPGGLGGMEMSLDLMYKAFSSVDAPAEHGFIVALGFRVTLLILAGIGVILYLVKRPSVPDDLPVASETEPSPA